MGAGIGVARAFALVMLGFLSAARAQSVGAGEATAVPVAAAPLVRQWAPFADPNERAFTVDVPRGWKAVGGTARRNALQYRNWVVVQSPDGFTLVSIGDPNEESYVAPSPLRPWIGQIVNGGANLTYRVEPYQTGPQYAVSWGLRQLASLCSGARATASRARPDMVGRIGDFSAAHDAGEAEFSCDRNGMAMSAYVFVHMSYLGAETGIWYADALVAFLAPAKVEGAAAGVLAHMIQSWQFDMGWLYRNVTDAKAVSDAATKSQAAISDSIMQGWEARGAALDRVMDEGSRVRLGVDIYADPATGNSYTVANTHNYYWINDGGTVVGTETDTAPKGFRRLARVPP